MLWNNKLKDTEGPIELLDYVGLRFDFLVSEMKIYERCCTRRRFFALFSHLELFEKRASVEILLGAT